MTRIFKGGTAEIWHDAKADEFYCYASDKLLRVVPSIGMAFAVIAAH